jgi:hypothetical protein
MARSRTATAAHDQPSDHHHRRHPGKVRTEDRRTTGLGSDEPEAGRVNRTPAENLGKIRRNNFIGKTIPVLARYRRAASVASRRNAS